MLLTDVQILDKIHILEESKSKGTMKIRGIFQRADEANNNKRVYPGLLLTREMTKLTENIKGRRLMGELDHPTNDSVKLSNVSHLITNLNMKGNEMVGEAELLNTPAGLTAQALIRGGVSIGISSRGMGTLSEGENGTKVVNEDFKLITFDLVADPSTRGAYPSMCESTEAKAIVEETMDKAVKEKVFLTLLKNKINEKTESPREAHRAWKQKQDDKNKKDQKATQAAMKAHLASQKKKSGVTRTEEAQTPAQRQELIRQAAIATRKRELEASKASNKDALKPQTKRSSEEGTYKVRETFTNLFIKKVREMSRSHRDDPIVDVRDKGRFNEPTPEQLERAAKRLKARKDKDAKAAKAAADAIEKDKADEKEGDLNPRIQKAATWKRKG